MDEDSDIQDENVNSEEEETSKNRRTQEDKNTEMFKKVLEEAISKIESKEKEEENRKIAEMLRKKYLKKYSDVFKKRLERGDTIRCNPVKIETNKDSNIRPINCRTPIPVEAHYRRAADREIKDFLKAGNLKELVVSATGPGQGVFLKTFNQQLQMKQMITNPQQEQNFDKKLVPINQQKNNQIVPVNMARMPFFLNSYYN